MYLCVEKRVADGRACGSSNSLWLFSFILPTLKCPMQSGNDSWSPPTLALKSPSRNSGSESGTIFVKVILDLRRRAESWGVDAHDVHEARRSGESQGEDSVCADSRGLNS